MLLFQRREVFKLSKLFSARSLVLSKTKNLLEQEQLHLAGMIY